MHFAKEMQEAQKNLEALGHQADISPDTQACIENPNLNMDLEHCLASNIDKSCFQLIADSDAILVLNYSKNGMNGYVGGATLMEIGLARHLDKKVFILHDLPSEDELRYVLEIKLVRPVILRGDLAKINEHL
jgi:hypothetical protein